MSDKFERVELNEDDHKDTDTKAADLKFVGLASMACYVFKEAGMPLVKKAINKILDKIFE